MTVDFSGHHQFKRQASFPGLFSPFHELQHGFICDPALIIQMKRIPGGVAEPKDGKSLDL